MNSAVILAKPLPNRQVIKQVYSWFENMKLLFFSNLYHTREIASALVKT